MKGSPFLLSFLLSLFPSCFDSQAPSVTYSFNAICLTVCKIEVVLSSIGKKNVFQCFVLCVRMISRLFYWKKGDITFA